MRKHMTRRIGLAAALIVGLGLASGGCAIDKPTAPALNLSGLDFTSFVVLGNSVSAGVVSGGLGGETQTKSFPALIAEAVGVGSTFEQPTISEPGIPNQLEIILVGTTPIIVEKTGTGVPTNSTLTRAYNNLAVPGANTLDILTDNGSAAGTISQVILRGRDTQLGQAITLNPTMLMVWIGNNDVLGGAVYGQIVDGVTTVPAAVSASNITALFGFIATLVPNADVVVANVPDVTSIPYVTYLTKGYTSPLTDATGTQIVFPVITPATGPPRQATVDDYILLPAAATLTLDPTYGGPTNPISNSHTLDSAEVTDLQAKVTALNNVIDTQAAAIGATVVDIYTFFNQMTTPPGLVVTEGGVDYTLDALFVSDGGIGMSLDGVHPTPAGNALVANYYIDRLNTVFGSNIPHVSYSGILFGKRVPGAKVPLDQMPDFRVVQRRLMEMYRVDK